MTPPASPKSLHIAFFNRAFHPEKSATAQLLTDLAEDLVQNYGCRVSVVAGIPLGEQTTETGNRSGRGILVQREQLGAIQILRARGTVFSKHRFLGRVCNYLTYFASACWAGLKLERPDVIIALTDPPVIGLAALLASRRFRCPLVVSYRDLFPEVAQLLEDYHSPLVDGVLTQVNRILLRHANRSIALGQAMRNRLVEEKGGNPDKICIIPDWADGALLQPGPRHNSFSENQGLQDQFVVMHSGNIGVSQNLEMLVEAAELLRDIPDLVVLIIGDGVNKSRLETQAQEKGLANVRFLPHQPKVVLNEVFASADCFVVSLKPGLAGCIMPSKLYGILAAGRPYVAAVDDQCDVAQITREHQCGLLTQPGDAKGLAENIRKLYQDRTWAAQAGKNARTAFARFDRPVGVQAYYDLCQQLAKNNA